MGHALAMNNIGELYEKGMGVEKDLDAAIEWYRKAAEQGEENAQSALERLAK
jgi:TPR repeat protein